MSSIGFETADSLAEDLAGFWNRPREEIRSRLTERNWQRIALIYGRLLNLIEEGAKYFARVQEIRRNPQWAPNRPIRAELKLTRVNEKIDRAERELFDALDISPLSEAKTHHDGAQ